MSRHNTSLLAATVAAALGSAPAFATNGYAPHGIGMTAKGMGGAAIAAPMDAVGVGVNPAGSAWLDDRIEVGADLFRPIRSAEISGMGDFDGSGSKLFLIPEFGYRRALNDQTAFALSVFGNGGMNTEYQDGISLFQGGPPSGTTGINLMQLFVVPSLSYKLGSGHAVGIGLNLAAQGFKARGIQGFGGFSNDASNLSNNDTDWSYGAGVRVGWSGRLNDMITVGATYQTRTYMTEYDDYAGLFAEQGDFDIPANFGAGIAIKATPAVTIAADIMRIQYSDIDSIGNSINNFGGCPAFGGPSTSNCLGGDNGPGFGWDDQTVYKIGVNFEVNNQLALRAGWNHGKSPIPSNEETLFNVLAPATVEDHLTLGATWKVDSSMEVTAAYMHAFENEIKDSGPGAFGGPSSGGFPPANIKMHQDSLGIAVTWKR